MVSKGVWHFINSFFSFARRSFPIQSSVVTVRIKFGSQHNKNISKSLNYLLELPLVKFCVFFLTRHLCFSKTLDQGPGTKTRKKIDLENDVMFYFLHISLLPHILNPSHIFIFSKRERKREREGEPRAPWHWHLEILMTYWRISKVNLRAETLAGRNFRVFRVFGPFSRKFCQKEIKSKFRETFFREKSTFLFLFPLFSTFCSLLSSFCSQNWIFLENSRKFHQ